MGKQNNKMKDGSYPDVFVSNTDTTTSNSPEGMTATTTSKTTKTKSKSSSFTIFSTSFLSSIAMLSYTMMVCLNLYKLMYPLAYLDLSIFPNDSFIQPLWGKGTIMDMKVYLSTQDHFQQSFLQSEFAVMDDEGVEEDDDELTETTTKYRSRPSPKELDTVLLWKQEIASPSLSKSFLLTSRTPQKECFSTTNDKEGTCDSKTATANNNNDDDPSFRYAQQWLDEAEQALVEEDGGILSTISAAGKGIESTSVLLTLYQSISRTMWNFLTMIRFVSNDNEGEAGETMATAAITTGTGKDEIPKRSTIHLPAHSPMWIALQTNSTLFVHVLVTRRPKGASSSRKPKTPEEAAKTLTQASRLHSVLLGQVDLIKYDIPHHITKPGRILCLDLVYLFRKYLLFQDESSIGHPPWDMEYAQPEYFKSYEMAQSMKDHGQGYPYWKPEVSVKYIFDEDQYPMDLAHVSGMQMVRTSQSKIHPTGIAHIPALHVDEIGLTSEKYIPMNETVTSLPLRITFDRIDWENDKKIKQKVHSTATAGGISPARWRLLSHLSESIESQKQLGFEQSDIDDLRRLIADTNLTLLAITMLASALHLLFEFLTFKSEVSFWNNNTDLTGLSVRSLFLDFFGQVIIVLFLIEKDSSLLMTIPSAFGCLIALWKCQRAAGLTFVKIDNTKTNKGKQASFSFWNAIPRLFGFELRALRLELHAASRAEEKSATKDGGKSEVGNHNATVKSSTVVDLHDLTMESDRIATSTLGSVLLPCVAAYTFYSLLYEEHTGWYSWLITSASSAVYALGFVLMTPQLFLNYKLKSVAHLPWRVLIYRSLNTFIDDLFSFIIRMPTMARISCFRDDIVFFIYLYQRWLYPVDASRPVEGGGDVAPTTDTTATTTEMAPAGATKSGSNTTSNPKSSEIDGDGAGGVTKAKKKDTRKKDKKKKQ